MPISSASLTERKPPTIDQRQQHTIRVSAYGAAATIYVALLASGRADKRYGPKPITTARRVGSQVAEVAEP